MPPMTEFIPQGMFAPLFGVLGFLRCQFSEDGDDSDDDDIVVGGVSQVYTCPITLTPLVEPMTSYVSLYPFHLRGEAKYVHRQICKHTFSKTSIYDYFKNNRSIRKKCPATGCNQQFTLIDLKVRPPFPADRSLHSILFFLSLTPILIKHLFGVFCSYY